VIFGFLRAPGSVGFDRSVSVGPLPSPGISLGLSGATISVPPVGNSRCNSAGVPAGDENTGRSLSANNTACAAGEPNVSAGPLDFRDDL
jgi:hypothetical protein